MNVQLTDMILQHTTVMGLPFLTYLAGLHILLRSPAAKYEEYCVL